MRWVSIILSTFLIAVTTIAGPVGFLGNRSSVGALGPEGMAAWALAKEMHSAQFICMNGSANLVDATGKPVELKSYGVIWYHQGDDTSQSGPVYTTETFSLLKQYLRSGGGLFLSGAAAAMVHNMGIERVKPHLEEQGNDRKPALTLPAYSKHPVFRELKFLTDGIYISDKGHPAYSYFTGDECLSRGMVLGVSADGPGGTKNIAEYAVDKGRIIVMGGRLPHYSNRTNKHRKNLEQLTANILSYLSGSKKQEMVLGPPVIPPGFESVAVPLERAIKDLVATCGKEYPGGSEYLRQLDSLRKDKERLGEGSDAAFIGKLNSLRREALLANPALDFEKVLLVKRSARNLGLPANWQSNSSIRPTGFDNEIVALSLKDPDGKLETVFKPGDKKYVGEVDLHFSGDRLLFSMAGANKRWQVHELSLADKSIRELPLIIQPDVNNYDACYLPNGNIIFTSTAPFIGVPCVGGSSHVTNIYILDKKTGSIRRLTFDQEHNWNPVVLNNGRVMYLRWEYSDIPHFVSRILFSMNPDGTNQAEYYGSNSYWPNSVFYAKPVPGHPSMVAGIVTGHHGTKRAGELVLFDPAKGRFEADGVVQRIPGFGKKVEPVVKDRLVDASWPKFLHPHPLNDKYYLVSAQLSQDSQWGLYLVDVFDNMLLVKSEPGYAMLEPVPLRRTEVPPVIPQRVDLSRKDATVFITDIYEGPGLKGVPRGVVRGLRLLTYHFSYHGMGGQGNRVGLDGPWDIKRVLGTVPVEEDGSAFFRVPANVPISMQPIDKDGKALQLMRSWTTAMPGENVSCVGCHEPQNMATPSKTTMAIKKKPADITPWYGKTRGFSFVREIQPVLDKYCVGCHDGVKKDQLGRQLPDLRDRPAVVPQGSPGVFLNGSRFTPSYMVLRAYVRTPTMEPDLHLSAPCEWHADTTRLFQMLSKGHPSSALEGDAPRQPVKLDAEAWDRLVTWFDLNAPAHGTWTENVGASKTANQSRRRREMMELYAGISENPESIGERPKNNFIMPEKMSPKPASRNIAKGWPFSATEARALQAEKKRMIDIGNGLTLSMVYIPAGEFMMGSNVARRDEAPTSRARIEKSFWMGAFEISNLQYAQFDGAHDSRIEHGDFLHFNNRKRGDNLNHPTQPVVRVSWWEAKAFCTWLSEKAGMKFDLPTEAQWEWACRAGSSTSMWYGSIDDDFGMKANLADTNLRIMARLDQFGLPGDPVPAWQPRRLDVNDGAKVSATKEHSEYRYEANPWGLFNMHGNVAEWTRSAYRPYPYRENDGGTNKDPGVRRVVRGGSWYDRPKNATASCRTPYRDYQKIYDVGFRVVLEE